MDLCEYGMQVLHAASTLGDSATLTETAIREERVVCLKNLWHTNWTEDPKS